MKTRQLPAAALLFAIGVNNLTAAPLGSAFSYQGRLTDAGLPANGLCDFSFVLHTNAVAAASNVGVPVFMNAVPVEDGLFTVTLDFGAAVFAGEARWLEIAARSNGVAAFTTLAPRQPLNPAPYALYALTPAGPQGPIGLTGPEGPQGPVGPEGPQGLAGATGPQGAKGDAGLTWRGGWSSATAYVASDAVEHDGSSWFAKQANTGSTPALGSSDWDLLAQKGETGAQGATGATGATGAQGPEGPQGPVGPEGPQGPSTTTANTLYIGSDRNAAQPNSTLALGTDNQPRLTLLENGFVGIGTDTPKTDLQVVGAVLADGFIGDGGGLTNLQPANLAPGTAAINISGNATTATTAGTAASLTGALAGDVTGTQGATVVASVGGQTAVSVSAGAIAANASTSANTPGTIIRRDAAGGFSAGAITATGYSGNGSGLTALNAGNLSSGTVADARLSGNVALRTGGNNFTGNQTVSGGSVGIGTTAPTALLDVAGDISYSGQLNKLDAADRFVATVRAADFELGHSTRRGAPGRALVDFGTAPERTLYLNFDNDWDQTFVGGSVILDPGNRNDGTLVNGLTFGRYSGEGIASKRTPGGTQYGLDFYQNWQPRLSIAAGGNVGIGTTSPQARLDVSGAARVQSLEGQPGQPLEIFANDLRALRLEPTPNANHHSNMVNVVAGSMANFIAPGVYGSVIGGGGAAGDVFGHVFEGGGSFFRWSDHSNSVYTDMSFLGGGSGNVIRRDALWSFLGGGLGNVIQKNAGYSFLGGGSDNVIGTNAVASFLGGGGENRIGGMYSVVPGGIMNLAGGNYSFAAGRRAKTYQHGTFVWADSNDVDFDPWIHCAGGHLNSFNVRATGGIYFVTGIDGSGYATAGPYVYGGSGSWSWHSDRKSKDNLAPVDGREILDRVMELPITSWNYKSQPPEIRHLGPMAQDFSAAFGLGETDTGISSVDANGVALAAIQGLNQKLEQTLAEKEARIAQLETRLIALERIVSQLSPRNGGAK